MAFKFGNIKSSASPKDLQAAVNQVDFLIEDHFTPNEDYYIFLLDRHPSEYEKKMTLQEINAAGYKSYVVLNAVDCEYNKDDLHGTGIVTFLKAHRSNWLSYVDYKNTHVTAIMAFGASMYSINGSADLLTTDFYDDVMMMPYYYMGHQIFKYDTFIYPVDELSEVFAKSNNISGNTTFKTRFMRAQMKHMKDSSSRVLVPDTTDVNIHLIDNKKDADNLFRQNMNANLVAFDTETNGFLFYVNKIHCLTICWNGIDGYYIPWELVDKKLLADNLMSCKHRTGANPKFDLKFFWQEGVSDKVNVTDTVDGLLHCLASDLKVGLKPMSYRFTQFGGYDIALDNYTDSMKKNGYDVDYSKIPVDILSKYATMDAICTWRCQVELWKLCDWVDKNFLNEKFPNWTIKRWYETQYMQIYREIVHVEYRGLYVNNDLMNKYRAEMQADVNSKKAELIKLWKLPADFNLFSTSKVGQVFEKMGFKCYGRDASDNYVTDDDAMNAWIRDGHDGVKTLAELRTENTCMNSFLGTIDNGKVSGWLQYMYHDPNDGNPEEGGTYRVMQSYKVMGTETFRFIGVNPNFQNIPTRNKFAPYIKKCVDTPPADLYVLTSDSGKEYRLAAFEKVLTQDGYKEAKDCLESDTIIESSDKPTVLQCQITKNGDSFDTPDPKIWFEVS